MQKGKVLITGCSGFIGSHLAEALIMRGYAVTGLVRESSNLQWIRNLDMELIRADFSDSDSLRNAVRGMDYLVHSAAVISAYDWETYRQSNVTATRNLLEACAHENPSLKRFVFVSSIAASGPAQEQRPVKETDACRPVSLYGRSKYLAEQLLDSYRCRLPLVTVRPTSILGIRQKELLLTIKLAKKRVIPILGDGKPQSTFCFIQDLVRALILVMEDERAVNGTYFVAHPDPISWRTIPETIAAELDISFLLKLHLPLLLLITALVRTVSKLSGRRTMISPKKILKLRKNYWLQDTELIRDELGFEAQIPFDRGLRDIIDWYRENDII